MSDDILMVYMTCPDRETAKALSRGAVDQRLAACANIFQPHESLYWWEGAVQNETEVAVILKTIAAQYNALEAYLTENHPYDVPCVVAMPLQQAYRPFADWIAAQTSGK